MAGELAIDVRDAPAVRDAVRETRPEVVLHLAAQPMVRMSLRAPALTFEVNVLGTVNVLEAVRLAGDSVRAVVRRDLGQVLCQPVGLRPPAPALAAAAASSSSSSSSSLPASPGDSLGVSPGASPGASPGDAADRAGEPHRFVETDPLGGHDPYSASKACAELVAAAYRESFFAPDAGAGKARIASARAGNVIGGGDFGEDRLVPDILRAYDAGQPVRVRNPEAVRPWQHVLNPLSGYLALAQALCAAGGDSAARAFNFGPRAEDARTVLEIVRRLDGLLDGALGYELDGAVNPPEAARLELDCTAAERLLRWCPRWDLDAALERVAAWHEAHRRGADMRAVGLGQLAEFADLQGTSRGVA